MRRTAPMGALLLAAGLLGAAPAACNVLRGVDRCEGDGDCAARGAGFRCDPEGRFCLDLSGVTPAPDAEVDAEAGAQDADAGAHDADAAPPPPACDTDAAFGELTLVKGFEDIHVTAARLTSDEKLLLYASVGACGTEACADVHRARWVDGGFEPYGRYPAINSEASEYFLTQSADGLLAFFDSSRTLEKLPSGEYGVDRSRIWTASRSNDNAEFSEPYVPELFKVDPPPNGGPYWWGEAAPYLHPDYSGRVSLVYFMSDLRGGQGGLEIFVATLDRTGGASTVENISAVNTPANEHLPIVTRDNKVLYFAREDENAMRHIYRSTRPTPGDKFGTATAVAELNSTYDEFPDWISDDQCRIYFASDRPVTDGGPRNWRLWVARRPK